MAPWNLTPSNDLLPYLSPEGEHWSWEFEKTTPGGTVAHKFTWNVNEFATAESFRSVGNRALCLMLVACAPDDVVSSLVNQVGRMLTEHQFLVGQSRLLEEPEGDDRVFMDRVSARVLKSIISARGSRPSRSAWSEDDIQEP
jgi:hypothetical protein